MPTKKRRIGFIPRFDVLKVIDNISEDENLSNSKVVNILIEEALYSRGLINKVEKGFSKKEYNNFLREISDFEKSFYKNYFKFDDKKEEFNQSKISTKEFKIFIQFLHFKRMMNVFNEND